MEGYFNVLIEAASRNGTKETRAKKLKRFHSNERQLLNGEQIASYQLLDMVRILDRLNDQDLTKCEIILEKEKIIINSFFVNY